MRGTPEHRHLGERRTPRRARTRRTGPEGRREGRFSQEAVSWSPGFGSIFTLCVRERNATAPTSRSPLRNGERGPEDEGETPHGRAMIDLDKTVGNDHRRTQKLTNDSKAKSSYSRKKKRLSLGQNKARGDLTWGCPTPPAQPSGPEALRTPSLRADTGPAELGALRRAPRALSESGARRRSY